MAKILPNEKEIINIKKIFKNIKENKKVNNYNIIYNKRLVLNIRPKHDNFCLYYKFTDEKIHKIEIYKKTFVMENNSLNIKSLLEDIPDSIKTNIFEKITYENSK